MNKLFTLAIALAIMLSVNRAKAQMASISVNASQVLHTNSLYLTGACIEDVNHEIYGGLYSQMIFGESFQEPASAACWQASPPTEAVGCRQTMCYRRRPAVGLSWSIMGLTSRAGMAGLYYRLLTSNIRQTWSGCVLGTGSGVVLHPDEWDIFDKSAHDQSAGILSYCQIDCLNEIKAKN